MLLVQLEIKRAEVADKKSRYLEWLYNNQGTLPYEQFNRYQTVIQAMAAPELIGIGIRLVSGCHWPWKGLFLYADGTQKWCIPSKISFCGHSQYRADITAIEAKVSGKHQELVNRITKMRRQNDGSYAGIDKTTQTKKANNTFAIAAKKTAAARREVDGSYRGIDKTVKTKTQNGTFYEAAKKTAATRRLPDGTYSGTEKTIRHPNSVIKKGRRRSVPCVYITKSGENIIMRSSWEWAFAKLLDEKQMEWKYEPETIVWRGKIKIPDFWILGIGLVEIKPKKFLKEVDAEFITKYNITVVTEECQEFPFFKYVKEAKEYRVCQK